MFVTVHDMRGKKRGDQITIKMIALDNLLWMSDGALISCHWNAGFVECCNLKSLQH